MNSTCRTFLYGATCSATYAMHVVLGQRPLPGAAAPRTPSGTSLPSSSYTPMTAASAIAGWVSSTASSSAGGDLVALVLDQLLDAVDDVTASRPRRPGRCRRCAASRRRRSSRRSRPGGRGSPSSPAGRGSQISPGSPAPTSLPGRRGRRAASRWTGSSLPTVPGGGVASSCRGTTWVPGDSSVMPYAWPTGGSPSRRAHAAASSASSGAAALSDVLQRRTGRSSSTAGCLARASTIGGATYRRGDPVLSRCAVEELRRGRSAAARRRWRRCRSGAFIRAVRP